MSFKNKLDYFTHKRVNVVLQRLFPYQLLNPVEYYLPPKLFVQFCIVGDVTDRKSCVSPSICTVVAFELKVCLWSFAVSHKLLFH